MTTLLEAVNSLLASIGEAPVSSLSSPIAPDASRALECLKESSRSVQTRGWWFNTELNYAFEPDATLRTITLPLGVLSITFGAQTWATEPIARGQVVYDRLSQSYTFSQGVTAVQVVWELPWEQLPDSAQHYIRVAAVRLFRTRSFVTDIGSPYSSFDEATAYSALLSDHLRNAGLNIHNNAEVLLSTRYRSNESL
jgi:hypothetical protein